MSRRPEAAAVMEGHAIAFRVHVRRGSCTLSVRMTSTCSECCDCGRAVPEAVGDSTLVSVKYGWRLTKEALPTGEVVPRWRCPTCWSAHRKRQGRPPAA